MNVAEKRKFRATESVLHSSDPNSRFDALWVICFYFFSLISPFYDKHFIHHPIPLPQYFLYSYSMHHFRAAFSRLLETAPANHRFSSQTWLPFFEVQQRGHSILEMMEHLRCDATPARGHLISSKKHLFPSSAARAPLLQRGSRACQENSRRRFQVGAAIFIMNSTLAQLTTQLDYLPLIVDAAHRWMNQSHQLRRSLRFSWTLLVCIAIF